MQKDLRLKRFHTMISETTPAVCTVESLVHAVQWGDLQHVEAAIEQHGMSPDTRDVDGCSLLHWAAINNRLAIAKYLVSKGANAHVTGGNNNENPLQWSLRCNYGCDILTYFLNEECSITHKSVHGCDALMIAVQSEQLYAVLLLLNAGADVNTVDNNGDTPLYWLLRKYSASPTYEFLDLQRLLLRFNASVTHRAKDGCNALHILALAGKGIDLGSALLVYKAGNEAMVESKNADGLTPKEIAVKNKNTDMVRFLYDAGMYRKYPYHLPTAVAALGFASAFLCLEWGGWVYGTLAFIPILVLCETLSQPYIHAGASRLPCGLAWGVIITAIGYFYVRLAMYFGFLLHVLALAWSVSIPYTLLRTMFTVPQHVYGDSADSRRQLIQKILDTERAGDAPPRFCSTCLVDRASASMHCSKCNMCVVSMDHHCPFVCNCVGRGNRRMFVMFTLAASTGCMAFFLLSLYAQYAHFCPDAQSPWGQLVAVQLCMLLNQPALLAIGYVTAGTSAWIAAVFCGQMGLIASETTTFEMMKKGNKGLDVLTTRGLRNVILFFQTGAYSICAPELGQKNAHGRSCSSNGKACSHNHAEKHNGNGDHNV